MARFRHQLDPGHEGLDVPGCYACKITGVSVAPSATPSRTGGAWAARNVHLENQWTKDMDAYQRLRRDGLQPPQIDGSHVLERADSRIEVEHGPNHPMTKAHKAGYISEKGEVNA